MSTAILIYTIVNGRKNYVLPSHSHRSYDRKLIVNYSPDPAKAKEFDTEAEAEAFLQNIANPYSRRYELETRNLTPCENSI